MFLHLSGLSLSAEILRLEGSVQILSDSGASTNAALGLTELLPLLGDSMETFIFF